MVAIPALHPGKAVVQVATVQVAVNDLLEVGAPEPIRPFEPLLVDLNKGYSWQWKEAWIFPEKVLKKSEPMSISGGSWGPDGLLYCTGHDHPELYVLRLPQAGSVLELVEIIPIENNGQGMAWDRSDPGTIYVIKRPTKQVVVSRLKKKGNP
jgi:hypothetical protein